MTTHHPPVDLSALFRLIARAHPNHSAYVRSVREHVVDAQRAARAGNDHYMQRQMQRQAAIAITISLLIDRGQRYGSNDEFEAADRDAHELMDLAPLAPWRFRATQTGGTGDENRLTNGDRDTLLGWARTFGNHDAHPALRLGVEPTARSTDEILHDTLAKVGLTTVDLRPSEHQWTLRHICDAYWDAYVDAAGDQL